MRKYKLKDLGEVKTIIKWQITRDLGSNTMKINYSAFICDLFIDENFFDCNANVVSIKASFVIDMTETDAYKEEDLHTYQRLIEKLIYLACRIRPDIAFAIGELSKYNADPQKSHLQAVKRVVQYLKGTMNLGLVYEKTSQQP